MIPTANNHIDKWTLLFAHKNISQAKNVTYGTTIILLVLLAASYGSFSINSKALSPNPDTVFYRISATIKSMERQFWMQSIEFLRQRKSKLKKYRRYIIVDETHDSYTGKLLKKEKNHKDKLTKCEKEALKNIHKYKPEKGDTGSYKYLVFAIVYGSTRRVIRVKALKRKEKYKHFIIKTLIQLKTEVGYDCVLFDRGFYDGSFVEKLRQREIPFILRARISKSMKEEYGIYRDWKCYRDFAIGKQGKGNLVLGADYADGKRMKWAFITNLEYSNWYRIRKLYKKRWNIENIFKATDGIQLRAQTNNPRIRMFCVCLSFLCYNAWQAKQKRKRYSLLNFIMNILEDLFEVSIAASAKSLGFYRDKLRLNLPFWGRVISSV